ncbi:13191_t:CDS:2, partial [Ambispora leptoticha]
KPPSKNSNTPRNIKNTPKARIFRKKLTRVLNDFFSRHPIELNNNAIGKTYFVYPKATSSFYFKDIYEKYEQNYSESDSELQLGFYIVSLAVNKIPFFGSEMLSNISKLIFGTSQKIKRNNDSTENKLDLNSSLEIIPQMTISDPEENGENDDGDTPSEFPLPEGPQRVKTIVSSSSLTPMSTSSKPTPLQKANRKRQKVALEPGHSTLDWADLKNSGVDLRNVPKLRKYTMEELRQHRTENDAWTALNGTIYNITPYLKFHPGGKKELMRCAGRDGTKLFMSTHSWINYDLMLDKCVVGFLINDNDGPSSQLQV